MKTITYQKAHEKVEAILKLHYPPVPLISAVKIAELDAILQDAREQPEKFAL